MSQLGRAVIVSLLAAAAGLTLSAQDPAPGGRQGGAGRGSQPPGTLVGGTLTPNKADERGWGWQVKALMNPATPRPLYNRAKEALLSDRQITSYTISSFDPDLYCEVAKHFDFIWFEMQHSTMSYDEIRRMMNTCPKAGAAPFVRMPDAFESSIQKATDIGALGIIGDLLYAQKQYDGAVREYNALVALNPLDKAGAEFSLAQAYLGAGKKDKAQESVLAALETAPGYRPAQKLLLELQGSSKTN